MSACVFTDWTWFIRTGSWFSGLWIVYIHDNNAHCKASRENISIQFYTYLNHISVKYQPFCTEICHPLLNQPFTVYPMTGSLRWQRVHRRGSGRDKLDRGNHGRDGRDFGGILPCFFNVFFTCFLIGKPSIKWTINVHLWWIYWLVVEPYPSEKWWNSSVGDTIPKWMEK